MDSQVLVELAGEIKDLHKSMKNLIEIVFAVSPLMILSTYGWAWRSTNSSYLLRVSDLYFLSSQLFTKDG
jgi:hypothetical protein